MLVMQPWCEDWTTCESCTVKENESTFSDQSETRFQQGINNMYSIMRSNLTWPILPEDPIYMYTCKLISYPHHRALADKAHSGLYILPCTWHRCCHPHRSHSCLYRADRCTALGLGRNQVGSGLCSGPGTGSAPSHPHLEMSLTFS